MNFPQKIIVHHTAVSYDKNPNQYEATNNFHKSKGWGGIGYHYLIEKDGTRKQGRKENQAGAHTSQKMMNWRSIGVCLTGDFDKEEPTLEQCKTLQDLLKTLQARYNIADKDVVPHRVYAPKSCWGKLLPADILGYLKSRLSPIPEWALESVEWAKKKKIATDWSDPSQIIVNADGELMMQRAGLIKEATGKGIEKYRWAYILHQLSKK